MISSVYFALYGACLYKNVHFALYGACLYIGFKPAHSHNWFETVY